LLSAQAILDRIVHIRVVDAEPGLFPAAHDAGDKTVRPSVLSYSNSMNPAASLTAGSSRHSLCRR
jgi:hypothetical protein